MNRIQAEIKAVETEMARLSQESQDVWKKADEESRETTDEERRDVETKLKDIEVLKLKKVELDDENRVRQNVKDMGTNLIGTGDPEPPKNYPQAKRLVSLGEQFVMSEGFKGLQARGLSGNTWSTGQIELGTKATLLEGDNYDAATGSPGYGAPLVPIDQQAGIQQILFERLTVADLLAQGSTNSTSIRYVRESLATNAAATVAEAGPKPESALRFDQADTPVRKIATFLPVSDEMLEDAAQIQSYINARLSLFVEQETEDQLLNGDNTGTNLNGLIRQVPAGNLDVASSATSANLADHIYSAITQIRTTSFLEPDGIIINPDDWEVLRLLKDDNKNYIAGPPFSNTGSGEPGDSLWGKRVVITQAMQGQVLIGAFKNATQVFYRGGLSVEASNSHASYFTTNLTAIRAERRLALAVYRPSALATVDVAS